MPAGPASTWVYEELGPGETVTAAGVEVTFAVDELYATALST